MEEDKMAETCKTNDRNKKCIQNFEENSLFGRSRLRWNDDFKEGCSSNKSVCLWCGVIWFKTKKTTRQKETHIPLNFH